MTHRRSITWKSAPRIAASKDSPAKYPKIFRDRHGSMTETAMCWGFDVGDDRFRRGALAADLRNLRRTGYPRRIEDRMAGHPMRSPSRSWQAATVRSLALAALLALLAACTPEDASEAAANVDPVTMDAAIADAA